MTFDVPPGLAERFAFAPGQSLTDPPRRRAPVLLDLRGPGPRAAHRRARGGGRRGLRLARARGPGRRRDRGPGAVRLVHPRPGRARAPRADRRGQRDHARCCPSPRSVLAAQDKSTVTLLYGNRRNDSVMFADEIADLKDAYPERICLVHVLSREPQEVELFNGRLDAGQAARAAAGHRRRGRGGPLVAVRPVRHGRGRDRRARRARRAARRASTASCSTSRTTRPPRPPTPRRAAGPGAEVTVLLDGRSSTVDRPARHPDPGRRPAGPARPAVRLQGRGVRHLPRPAGRGRGHHAPQLRPGAGGTRRGLRPHLPVPARLRPAITVDYDA